MDKFLAHWNHQLVSIQSISGQSLVLLKALPYQLLLKKVTLHRQERTDCVKQAHTPPNKTEKYRWQEKTTLFQPTVNVYMQGDTHSTGV